MKKYGIHKINISTELKAVYMKTMEEHLSCNSKFNMIHLVNERYEKLKEFAKSIIIEFK